MEKSEIYGNLVSQRKACRACMAMGYKNQSELGAYDTDHIGNMSAWANDLNADLMIVAQDFSNIEIYQRDKGLIEPKPLNEEARPSEYSTATNYYLRELTRSIGRDIGLPTGNTGTGIFITNEVLCMKPGAMNAPNPSACVKNCGANFLKPLIDLVQPKAVVTLGAVPTTAVLEACAPNIAAGMRGKNFGEVFRAGPFMLGPKLRLFPMYHPGRLGQIGRKRGEQTDRSGFELMKTDWSRMKEALRN